MIATAMTVVAQNLYHAALADTTMTTFADHALQFFLECLEFDQADLDLLQM